METVRQENMCTEKNVLIDENILTDEEKVVAEKFHYLLDRNMGNYNPWFDPGYITGSDGIDKELNAKVLAMAQEITANGACMIGYYGMNILHQLVWHNFYAATEILLKKGINPNTRGQEGKGDYTEKYKGITPLHLACHMGNYNMVKLLLDYGADMSLCDDRGRNCFHFLASEYYNIYTAAPTTKREPTQQRVEIAKLLMGDVDRQNAINMEVDRVSNKLVSEASQQNHADEDRATNERGSGSGQQNLAKSDDTCKKEHERLHICDINKRDLDGITPLMRLVQNKHNVFSNFLTPVYIKYGADIMAKDKQGNTALMYAAINMHKNAAVILMENQELINMQNNAGDTALHMAIGKYPVNGATSYMLCEYGADLDIKNKEEITARALLENSQDDFYWKYLKKHVIDKQELDFDELFEMISNYAREWMGGEYDDHRRFVHYVMRKILQKVDQDDDTELLHAKKVLENMINSKDGSEAVQMLQEEGFDFSMPFCEYRTATTLRDICFEGAWRDTAAVEKLNEIGVDLNVAFAGGRTPAQILADELIRWDTGEHVHKNLLEALKFCSKESMEVLNHEGVAAVHLAAEKNSYMLMEKMIEMGVDVNLTTDAPSESGNTPLHIACMNNNARIAKMLLEAGADDSMVNEAGETPAHCLIVRKTTWIKFDNEACYEVMEHMKHIDKVNVLTGETPLILLQRVHHSSVKDITQLLIKKGANVNQVDNRGYTPLLLHADYRYEKDVMKLLLEAGADIKARDSKGNGVLHYILRHGNLELARFLIKKGAAYNISNDDGVTPVDMAVEKGYDVVLELMMKTKQQNANQH